MCSKPSCCSHNHEHKNEHTDSHVDAHHEHKDACCNDKSTDQACHDGESDRTHKQECCGHSHNHNGDHHGEACCQSAQERLTTQTFTLTGLHCVDCAAKMEKVISKLEGVSAVEVQYSSSKMSASYDRSKVSPGDIVKRVRSLGYDVQEPTASTRRLSAVFRIEGMDCADCASKLERKVGALSAVTQANVNFGAAKMTVEHDGTAVEAIIRTVQQAGYEAFEEKSGKPEQAAERPFWVRNKRVLSTGASGLLFAAAWMLSWIGAVSPFVSNTLYALAIVVGGYRIAKSGLYGLKSGTVGMDALMTIAAIGAAAIGEWSEGAAVVFLFSLGETLEAYTMDKTRKSIRSLMDLTPNEALVRRDGLEMILPVEEIQIGDTIVVKPGEKLAMDGLIRKGESSINQAPITGESIPVEKGMGDEVFAGTINQQGALEIEVTKLAKDNTLSRIIHLVEEAQSQKAPSQRFVDAFSKYYTPAVMIAAVGIAVVPTLLFQQPFDTWFYRALMMLVVSCPCALVISTPVSIVAAIGNAAKNGILMKGGAHLERLGAVSAVAFDKTGTLTAGVPRVTKIVPVSSHTAEEIVTIAAALEKSSEHPLAEAIVEHAIQQGLNIPASSQFTSLTGCGVKAEVDQMLYYLGSPRWFRNDLKLLQADRQIDELEASGQTVMLLGTADRILGIIALADAVRANSKAAIGQLKAIGMKKVVMLTGDNSGTAKAVAEQVGGIEYKAELLPQDKVTIVKELNKLPGGVAMVGDGINDAPALATATVGIAMGAAGTDTAIETADVALMSDDLSKLSYTVELSRSALQIIKQNIAFSLLVKLAFLIMIFAGWSTLWMAVLADTGSSLIVIANGMRLLRNRRESKETLPSAHPGSATSAA